MGKRVKRLTEDESESSSASSSDEMSPRRRHEARRNTRKKEGKVIKKILEELTEEMRKQSKKLNESLLDTREMRKQLEKLTESHNDLCKKWDLSTNGTRSQPKQLQPPRYRLVFTPGDFGKTVEKGKNIEINVALVDVNNGQTVENGPLAYATVELVVVNAEFNQHDNQHNWSTEDFERHIVTKQNSPTTNVCQSVKSTVSNGRFNLVHGVKCHSASTIFSNSSNKKVRLGVMVVSPTEERVLEGLSTSFFVRGHDRPNRQKQKGQLPNMQNSSSPDSSLAGGFSVNISGGNNATVPPQPHSSQQEPVSIQQHQVPDLQMSTPDSFWESLLNSDLAGAFGMQFNNRESEYLMIIVPKEAKQTYGKRDLVIEPLEPDGSVGEVPLKRNLALFDHNTNITPTSSCDVLASAQEDRTQGDISEPFLTKDHSLAGQPLSSWFHRTDEELTVQCQTEKNPGPKDAARCLASSRVAHLIASKLTGIDPISPRPKGPARCLAPAPPPPTKCIMATARDVHPLLASKPIGPSVRAWMMSSVASNPTVTSRKGITEHHATSKATGPRVAGVTLPTMVWTMPSMAHLFGWKHMTGHDGIKFGLESYRGWVHPKENTQISWMELSLTRRLRHHVSRTHFTHHRPRLSFIQSPSSLDSHPRLGRASTTDPNQTTGGNPCVLRRLLYPPPWCFSSVFVNNGSRSVYEDCLYSSSDHASVVIHATTGHRILDPDLGSPLPPMATTERRGLHECMRSLAAGPGTGVHDATKGGTRNGRWSQVLDWRFFLGFSFV